MSDLTPEQLDLEAVEKRLAIDHSMSSTYTKARVFPHLFPIGREPLPCAIGKPHAECEMNNTWLNIDGERRKQCDCTTDDELVLEYIVTNDVPALIAKVRELEAQTEQVRSEIYDELARSLMNDPKTNNNTNYQKWLGRLVHALGDEA